VNTRGSSQKNVERIDADEEAYCRRWFVRGTSSARRQRMYCFPYAGGNALGYLSWGKLIGGEVDICGVQPPGRGLRHEEKLITRFDHLIESMLPLIPFFTSTPYVFFGHSLGALMAFELVRVIEKRGLSSPDHLFVSGCCAPQFRDYSETVDDMSDKELIHKLQTLDGTPPEVLNNTELMDFIMPVIRADFSVAHSYRYQESVPIRTPISVLFGRHDEYESETEVTGWECQTSGSCKVYWFDGGHFFVNERRDEVIDVINANL
jgi:medium-chain acyl-[acyl-carrier-protein] hydrolase